MCCFIRHKGLFKEHEERIRNLLRISGTLSLELAVLIPLDVAP